MGNDQQGAAPANGQQPFASTAAKGERVLLNVYEPADQKQNVGASFGFGVYHTGVEVFGTEYMFAGSPESSGSGIHNQTPRVSPPGSPWVYNKTVELGKTALTKWNIQDVIAEMGKTPEWAANTYNLMAHNCNHFSDAFSKRITEGKTGIPSWVNRAATFGQAFMGSSQSGKAPAKLEQKPSVFATGSGYSLAGDAKPAGKPDSKAKPAATSSGSGAASGAKKNPWRDPNFMPGKEARKGSEATGVGASRPGSASVSAQA